MYTKGVFVLKVVAKLEIIRQLQMAKLLGDIEKIRIGGDHYYILNIPGFKEEYDKYYELYEPLTCSLCFDEDYMAICLDLQKRKGIRTIVDIGCAFGFQNYFFKEYEYIGINSTPVWGEKNPDPNAIPAGDRWKDYKIPFFREGEENVRYYVAHFPTTFTSEMVGDCFISNMSVGYGELKGVTEGAIANAFSLFPCGYANVPPEIERILDSVFEFKETIHTRYGKNIYFYKKGR